MTEGIVHNMPAEEYRAVRALSHSGIEQLMVSPLRYWHLNLNPARPREEPTDEQTIGTALHCAVLEPQRFQFQYSARPEPEDYPSCLVVIDDLRQWLKDKGLPSSGKTKAELIDRVQAQPGHPEVFDTIRQTAIASGKTLLKRDEFQRVIRMKEALRSEPKLLKYLDSGNAEVSVFATDAKTGVPLKARFDWLAPNAIVDLKTFTARRNRPIDKSVSEAIYYERYFMQAYWYTAVARRAIQEPLPFILAFVESDEPHEVRLRRLGPTANGTGTLYWNRARTECEYAIRLYAECVARWGPDRPWRYEQQIEELSDEEMPGMAYV